MDVNWKDNLDQILLMYETGIECEINKTISAFESLFPPMNQTFASCFFDILKNRMIESLRKIQMSYLAEIHQSISGNLPDDSSEVVLVSVTTTEQSTNSMDDPAEEDSLMDDPAKEDNSMDISPKDNSPTVEAAPKQTMEESIDAAIAEILNGTDEEVPNITADTLVKNQQTENVTNESVDEVVSADTVSTADQIDEQVTTNQTDEQVTIEETNEIVSNEQLNDKDSNSENVDESNSSDKVSDNNRAVTPESPLVQSENEQSSEQNMNESVVSEKEIDEEEMNNSSQDTSTDDPFLGFDQSIPLQAENLLKRKTAEAMELEDSSTKKRKTSCEIPAKEGEADDAKGKEGGDTKDAEKEEGETEGISTIDQNSPVNQSSPEAAEWHESVELVPVVDNVEQNSPEPDNIDQTHSVATKNYNTESPNNSSAVFISRPSPQMVQRMLRQGESSVLKDDKISAFCFLCEKTIIKTYAEQKQHILLHTGELSFYCLECRMPQSQMAHENCSTDNVLDIFDEPGSKGALKAYMCKWCNYIQVHKSRIMLHLEHEHDALDPNFNRNIERVTLVPDLTPLTWTVNTEHAFIEEQKRFICSIENCNGEYVNANEFRNHFVQYHNQQNSFNCPHCNKVVVKLHRTLITDIFQHFQLHNGNLHECILCGHLYGNEYDMLQHMARYHYGENLTYRYSQVQSQGEVEKRECTIWLRCNVCDARFENCNKATDHFVKTHKSFYIDFDAIKMVKRTTVNGITSSFTPVEKKAFSFRRSLNCKLCDHMPKTKKALLEHFNRVHPMHEIAVKLGKMYVTDHYKEFCAQNLAFDNHMVYYCAICRDVGHLASMAFISVQDVHTHWKHAHVKINSVKPFQFYAVEFVACYYCNLISSFHEVNCHQKHDHPNEPIIISSALNIKKCALCDYTGDDLAHHMKYEHELVLRTNSFNPNRISDDTLNKLLAIDIHKKLKCGHCVQVYETLGEVQNHIVRDHRMEIKYDTFFDSHSVKIIAGCCMQTMDLHEFLNHLADPNHIFPNTCSKCNFHTNELLEFVDHQVNVHQIGRDANFMYRRLLQTRFWASKVIFGNGLVLTKLNLLGTEFDDSQPFAKLVEDLLKYARDRINIRHEY